MTGRSKRETIRARGFLHMLGIVSDEDFDSELNDKSQHIDVRIKDIPHRGRVDGDNNLPDSLRKIIGEDAAVNGSKDSLGQMLGVSNSSISAYKNGATSTASYNEPKPDLLAHITRGKAVAIKRATHKMKLALSHITEEKLEGAKAKDLAGIAKDMSALVRNLEPEKEVGNKNVVFQFFAPQPRSIDSYATMVLDE